MFLAKELFGFTLTEWTVTHGSNREKDTSYKLIPADVRPFGAWYDTHFPGISTTYESNGGLFAATRADIHKRPREFYQKLLDEVSKGTFHEANHFIERAWVPIFNPLPESSLDIFA